MPTNTQGNVPTCFVRVYVRANVSSRYRSNQTTSPQGYPASNPVSTVHDSLLSYCWKHRTRNIRLRLKCDGTRAGTRFRLSAKRTSPFTSAWASVQSTTGSRVVRINGSNAGYTMFWGRVKSTGHPLHSPVSPSLPLPCVTVCHHISAGF